MNTEWYLEHCINKTKPELHCDGKCQLEKQSEQKTNYTWLKVVSEFIGVIAPLEFPSWTSTIKRTIHHFYFTSQLLKGYQVALLKPPLMILTF